MPNLPTFKYWPPNLIARNTKELISFYERGFQGAFRAESKEDIEAEEELVASMSYQDFSDAAYANHLVGSGEGKLSLAYECVQKLNPKEYPGKAQRTGCCVSRATVNAFTASYAYEVWNGIPDDVQQLILQGHTAEFNEQVAAALAEEWPTVPYPEEQTFDHVTIYGERGHRGQGANCGTLANASRNKTGLLPRGTYDIPGFGKYDCSRYDDNQAARSGPNWPSAFREFTNKHRVREVTGVGEIEAARDAIANNYGLSVCSGYATGNQRPTITDSAGNECAGAGDWRGSWAHAMAWLGCDDRTWAHQKYGGPIFLVCNSWGAWNSGPTRIYGTDKHIPPGCFWVKPKDAARMLQGGAYVLSNIQGFPRRPVFVNFW